MLSVKKRKLIIYLAALAAVMVLVLIIKDAGSYVVVSQPPQKADVIIVLSGGIDARTQRGIELNRQGYAHYLLFTCAPTDSPKTYAVAEGISAHAVILDRRAQNTYQNATYSKALMGQYGLHSAIVVSSDYQMRRASLIFAHVFRGTGTTFTYVSVQDPGFHPERWWTSRQTMLHMAWEYMGMAAFYLGLGPYITDAWVWHSPFWYLFRYMH